MLSRFEFALVMTRFLATYFVIDATRSIATIMALELLTSRLGDSPVTALLWKIKATAIGRMPCH